MGTGEPPAGLEGQSVLGSTGVVRVIASRLRSTRIATFATTLALFDAIYGIPSTRSLASSVRRSTPRTCQRHCVSEVGCSSRRRTETSTSVGGPREAAIRAILYIRMPDGVVDERGFNLLRRMREEFGKGLPLSDFKQLVREQFLMLLIDERRAVEVIPIDAQWRFRARRWFTQQSRPDD